MIKLFDGEPFEVSGVCCGDKCRRENVVVSQRLYRVSPSRYRCVTCSGLEASPDSNPSDGFKYKV